MRTDLFDFDLPESSIALHPATPRDASRLLVVHPVAGACARDDADLTDAVVRDLADYLRAGDALVLNDTRVIRAALTGVRIRADQRANIAVTLIRRVDGHRWRALAKPQKRLAPGDRVSFPQAGAADTFDDLDGTVTAILDAGEVELAFDLSGTALDEGIARIGEMPLPPYIASKRAVEARDQQDYQTIYAGEPGAVAAPTAGLHFTPELFDKLAARGISKHTLTLHVGPGTFLPVKADDVADHKMHAEWGVVSTATAERLNAVRAAGGRIVAVGTTSLRLLESAAREDGQIQPWSGETSIFITPGYKFRAVDLLMTNLHLPKSTLFMLVSAFSGLGTMRAAYGHAIRGGYRFYSYGDACLLFPASDRSVPETP